MSPRSGLLVVQVCALLALSVSVALLVDHLGVSSAYCHVDSGCAVARDAATRWFGVLPLPLIGLVGFSALLGSTLAVERWWGRALLLVAATLGGVSGLLLLFLQAFLLKRFCPWCVVIDWLAVVVLVQSWIVVQKMRTVRLFAPSLRPLVVLVFALVAVLSPVVWPHFRPKTPVPAALLPYQTSTQITVVEFVDFQCPYCKALYPTIEQLRREFSPQLRLYRLHVPLSYHPLARQAAQLLQCAPTAEQSERIERALFEATTLTERTLRDVATAVAMTDQQVTQCWSDQGADRMVQGHIDLYRQLGRPPLPTTFVGGERISGAMPAVVYRSAIARVRRPQVSANGQAMAFWVLVALLLLTVYRVGNGFAQRGE